MQSNFSFSVFRFISLLKTKVEMQEVSLYSALQTKIIIMKFKRYCKTLTLQDNEGLIRKYKEVHSIGKIWSEIIAGMKEVGILDMEIYISGN